MLSNYLLTVKSCSFRFNLLILSYELKLGIILWFYYYVFLGMNPMRSNIWFTNYIYFLVWVNLMFSETAFRKLFFLKLCVHGIKAPFVSHFCLYFILILFGHSHWLICRTRSLSRANLDNNPFFKPLVRRSSFSCNCSHWKCENKLKIFGFLVSCTCYFWWWLYWLVKSN